jgi:hypothetical protein
MKHLYNMVVKNVNIRRFEGFFKGRVKDKLPWNKSDFRGSRAIALRRWPGQPSKERCRPFFCAHGHSFLKNGEKRLLDLDAA